MIQFLRGTSSQLQSSNQVFAAGQPIFESDSGQLKIGNGTSTFANLPYVGASSTGEPAITETDNGYYVDYNGIRYLNHTFDLKTFESILGGTIGFRQDSSTKLYQSNSGFLPPPNMIPGCSDISTYLSIDAAISSLSMGQYVWTTGAAVNEYGEVAFNVVATTNPANLSFLMCTVTIIGII